MVTDAPIMDFNPVKFNYNERYTKNPISNFGEVIIDPIKGSSVPARKLVFPCIEGADYVSSKVVEMEKLKTKWREVYRVKFDKTFDFSPGDSIGLMCPNSDTLVDEMMRILNTEDFYCRIERTNGVIFTYYGTVRDFFKYYFDFTSLPKKALLVRLSRSCEETDQRHAEYLCSREGTKDYLKMGARWNNVIDFIKTFRCKPILEDLLGDCEIIKPRYFSLVNKVGESSEILIGTISKSFDGFVRYGHVSNYLINSGSEEIEIYLRPNFLFRMTRVKERILGICTGTGIAPFLSFVSNLEPHQNIWLVYGFRDDEDDISRTISSDERLKITRIKSSDGTHVTDYVRENALAIKDYVCDEYPVYVCGKMEMQREVFRLFKEMFMEIVSSKRLIFDLWS